jgi:hypothetical protein
MQTSRTTFCDIPTHPPSFCLVTYYHLVRTWKGTVERNDNRFAEVIQETVFVLKCAHCFSSHLPSLILIAVVTPSYTALITVTRHSSKSDLPSILTCTSTWCGGENFGVGDHSLGLCLRGHGPPLRNLLVLYAKWTG